MRSSAYLAVVAAGLLAGELCAEVIVLPGSGRVAPPRPAKAAPAPVKAAPVPTAAMPAPSTASFSPRKPFKDDEDESSVAHSFPMRPAGSSARPTDAVGTGISERGLTVIPCKGNRVYVASARLQVSNVVLQFADGSRQRFEGLSGQGGYLHGTGPYADKPIVTLWVKAGANFSGDGPGYGQRFDLPPALPARESKPPVRPTRLSTPELPSSANAARKQP